MQTITFSGDYPELIDISLTTYALDRTYAVMLKSNKIFPINANRHVIIAIKDKVQASQA